jgi:hypothetical protein
MRRIVAGVGALVAAVSLESAFASEVVHFKNGSQMAVLAHSVSEGMVHVVLGPESTIAFPADMVERIVSSSGEETFAHDGNAPSSVRNQRVAGDARSPVVDTRVGGRPMAHQVRGRWIGNELEGNPHVGRDPGSGLAVYRPFPTAENGMKNVALTGRLDMLDAPAKAGVNHAQEGPIGSRPFGKGYVAKLPEESGGKALKKSPMLIPREPDPVPPAPAGK